MSFTMPVFFLFLPAVLLLYRIIPGRWKWVMLLAASLLFYAWHNVWLLSLILTTILVTYFCARLIEEAETQKEKKGAVVCSTCVCLGILAVFKYLDFITGNIVSLANLCGADIHFAGFGLLLPMGISFYVFQTMSYTFDVYRGTVPAERHLGYYALFVTFFPQLVAGPIERPENLLPQLRKTGKPQHADLSEGFSLLIRGYAKKVLIADYLSGYVDHTYSISGSADGSALAVATILFAFQIYCDFSGYSDIAQGCARFMGIRLMDNFRLPYRAASIREFWRRWHISLTDWFTDYLYIPLGGSRNGSLRTGLNILITFLISGLWHGANWTYVIWGGLHGVYLILERLIKRPPGRVVTFSLVCFAWVFFRSETTAQALEILERIFSVWRPEQLLADLGMTRLELLIAGLLLCLLPMIERVFLPAQSDRSGTSLLAYYYLILAIFVCRILVLTQFGSTSFIYFQF